MANDKYFTLNTGVKMPSIGIGTWMAPDHEIEKALDLALQAGYRHIDTAPVYLNEKVIGQVLKKWLDSNKIKREDLFIVTKLPAYSIRSECVEEELRKSLSDLQLSYVDMYLLHTPFGIAKPIAPGQFQRHENGDMILDLTTDLIAVWQKMEKMVELGLTKNIGVSNFNKNQLKKLIENSKIKPSNLQIEFHIYLQQKCLVDYCKSMNVLVTAYSPLGSGGYQKIKLSSGLNVQQSVLQDKEVSKLAKIHEKTPAQILLRWIIQSGIVPIPKSTNPERLQQNFDVYDFQLSKDEMSVLSKLDKEMRVCDLKAWKGVEKHPEFPYK